VRSRTFRLDGSRLVTWLGVCWIYSAVFWLWAVHGAYLAGWGEGLVANLVRLALTLALGIGLCATERWAWAGVVSVAFVYGALATLVAVAASWTLATPSPTTLSWMPVFFGLNTAECRRVCTAAWATAALSALVLWLLWSAQEHCDIPHRRPFRALLRFGWGPAVGLMAADGYLIYDWWMHAAR